jgi:hypothetical protein
MPSSSNLAAAIVLTLGIAAQAQAQTMSVKEYDDILNGVEGTAAENGMNISWYIFGLNNGLDYVAGAFHANGAAPLSCNPSRRTLQTREFVFLIDRELKERPDLWRKDPAMPVAHVMFEAMRREFPCR